MSDLDESGLSMAEERQGLVIETGIMAVRKKVSFDPSRSSEIERDCGECGDPIPEARLAAAPWAMRCVDCQGRVERR